MEPIGTTVNKLPNTTNPPVFEIQVGDTNYYVGEDPGDVKTALERSLGSMGMSIPTVIYGKNFLAKSFGDEAWTVVVFECDGQRLEVKLFLKPAAAAPAQGSPKAAPVYVHR